MKINIKAKPNSKEEQVEKISENEFVVSVKEPPIGGRANTAILRALADYLNISSSHLRIVSGYTSRQKVVEIL